MHAMIKQPRWILVVTAMLMAGIPALCEVYPSGGHGAAPIGVGSVIPIRWTNDLEATSVDLVLWNGALQQWTEIARNVPADQGEYHWQVPSSVVPGDRYRVGVRDAARPIRTLFSASWLSIGLPAPLVTGVANQIDHGMDVHVSPLPASDRVTVTWTDRQVERLEIVDVARRVLTSWDIANGSGTTQLDLRGLPTGSHFLRILAADGRLVVKPLPVIR